MKVLLALESGRTFLGTSFGAEGETAGEVVFNTSMAGYQEILTDPSYEGQIITMTSPHIGNYGVNEEDAESRKPFGAGLIVRQISGLYSNWRAKESLPAYLQRYGLVGVTDIDTRALTKHIRDTGALRGIVSTRDLDPKNLVAKARAVPSMAGSDLAKNVTCEKPYQWTREGGPVFPSTLSIVGTAPTVEHSIGGRGGRWIRRTIEKAPVLAAEELYRVVVMDFGVKYNTLRNLSQRNCQVIVVPAQATAEQILAFQPNGILISNGPGDPSAVSYGIDALRKLVKHLAQRPVKERFAMMGICLGHQLLGLALGGKTFKLKFGHRGGNHPVKDLTTGKVEITSQNHGFAVDAASLPASDVEVTHMNLNDHTCEGLRHRTLPIFAVQYHPEAAPGPHDARYLFDRFVGEMAGKN
ncbi:MAG: glutamine-hydrolyzing carbamoyl-phosphate synthase small subunit [Elusimicrobiota bacterium]|jgi:carbamoyl-phosphate synthase small subunit